MLLMGTDLSDALSITIERVSCVRQGLSSTSIVTHLRTDAQGLGHCIIDAV